MAVHTESCLKTNRQSLIEGSVTFYFRHATLIFGSLSYAYAPKPHRFHVAVNNSFLESQAETPEKRVRDASNQGEIEPVKVVLLDQLIKIHSKGYHAIKGGYPSKSFAF